MGKHLLIFIFSLLITFSYGQITTRVPVNGVVKAALDEDVEGIVVYNRATNKGTITNRKGEFKIVAGIGDRIEVVAMQFQKFSVLVDQGIIDSKRLSIILNETVNTLEEVIVRPYDLSGNVKVDVKKVKIAGSSGLNEVINETRGRINDANYDFKPDSQSPVENTVFLEDRMINGLNFVNLFKLAFSKRKDNEDKKLKDLDVKMRNVYTNEFFSDVLLLEEKEINDFIFYVEERGLDASFFNEGRELDLLEFLVYQSKQYRSQQQ
ncbi:hypothetical protein [Aquimarina brevivitae]|uniref:Carboxypeptidase-like protein n=1 Tax=Aquimarina brevivitae TaxID=323412 RepID=A0A4Q7NY59_9FLAO|nr:hypothetical protein [Aquimarina brevivitae]RZS91950.1 hypothetical protein EV197_3054 [Aquimarina brevivitae]